MAQWEYHVVTTGTTADEIESACSDAGETHWELVSAVVVEASRDEWKTRLIFKRDFALRTDHPTAFVS